MYTRNFVKRIDYNLRARYPELTTVIYEIKQSEYLIYCSSDVDNFNELTKEFESSIRFITTPVELTNEKPKNFKEVIDSIDDNYPTQNFCGFPLTTLDFINLLSSKFSNIQFLEIIGNNSDGKIRIIFEKTDKLRYNQLQQYLATLDYPNEFVLTEKEPNSTELSQNLVQDDVTYVYSPYLLKSNWNFEKRDEDLWYQNLDRIYDSQFTRSDLYFYDESAIKCFADYSFNNINIRNMLLLYDKIFLIPPFEKPINFLLESQRIHKKELYNLIELNKINFVLIQPLSRYDSSFLNEVSSINNSALISRRALSALLLLEIVSINKNYFITQLELIPYLKEISNIIGKLINVESSLIYPALSWPIKVLRQSFDFFAFGSVMKIGGFGVNNAIEPYFSHKNNRDLKFDFMINATNIHLADALNAAYFPYTIERGYSDRFYSMMMGNILNSYRNLSIEKMMDFYKYKKELADKEQIIDPIRLFEINEYIPINELQSIIEALGTPQKIHSLVKYIITLNEEDRKEKIMHYNNEIKNRYTKNKAKFQWLDFGYSAALDTAGIWVPFIGTGAKGLELLSDKIGIKSKTKNFIMDKLENIFNSKKIDEQNIDFLTKLNRVARLKQNYE